MNSRVGRRGAGVPESEVEEEEEQALERGSEVELVEHRACEEELEELVEGEASKKRMLLVLSLFM